MQPTHAELIGARVWADGFGRWHAAIPADRNDGAGLILDARRCILDELVLREQKAGESAQQARTRLQLSRYVRENVARRHHQDANLLGYVEFLEYDITGDSDPKSTNEPTPQDGERAYRELANGKITVDEAEQRGAFAPTPAPDYAEKIGKDLVDRHIHALTLQYGQVRNWETVERIITEATREGYALGLSAGVKP